VKLVIETGRDTQRVRVLNTNNEGVRQSECSRQGRGVSLQNVNRDVAAQGVHEDLIFVCARIKEIAIVSRKISELGPDGERSNRWLWGFRCHQEDWRKQN